MNYVIGNKRVAILDLVQRVTKLLELAGGMWKREMWSFVPKSCFEILEGYWLKPARGTTMTIWQPNIQMWILTDEGCIRTHDEKWYLLKTTKPCSLWCFMYLSK